MSGDNIDYTDPVQLAEALDTNEAFPNREPNTTGGALVNQEYNDQNTCAVHTNDHGLSFMINGPVVCNALAAQFDIPLVRTQFENASKDGKIFRPWVNLTQKPS